MNPINGRTSYIYFNQYYTTPPPKTRKFSKIIDFKQKFYSQERNIQEILPF